MESKYYTPSIEEFGIGFEYESAESFMDGTVKTQEQFDNAKWIKNAFVNQHDFPYVFRALTGKNAESGFCGIRVKYLDKEDIESLGFETASEVKLKTYAIKNPGTHFIKTTLKREYVDEEVIITLFDKQRLIIRRNNTRNLRTYDNWKTYDVFVGVVKNKSELQKIMQQLNIQ